MTSYRTKEEVEKSFEEEFTTVLATHQVGKNLLTDVRLVNPEVKAHIHSLRLSDLESIEKGVEKIKTECQKANGTFKYDSCYDDVILYLKSLKQ